MFRQERNHIAKLKKYYRHKFLFFFNKKIENSFSTKILPKYIQKSGVIFSKNQLIWILKFSLMKIQFLLFASKIKLEFVLLFFKLFELKHFVKD